MNQVGKASAKRSKPSYIYSIVGVAIVLLILGVLGWFFLNAKKLGNVLKERVQFHVWLSTPDKKRIDSLKNYIAAQPYTKTVEYVDKEKAKALWNKDNDPNWTQFIDENPLPESIDFFANAAYVNKDSANRIKEDLVSKFGPWFSEVQYPKDIVNNLDNTARRVGIIILIVAIIFSVIVIVSIDNTIRLAMFSNRFLIKTMQMVGATRGFIAKPMNIRAVINGLISAGIAIGLILMLMIWMENTVPEFRALRDNKLTAILFLSIIVIGVGISLYSTHRSVIKYLKMKLDDLY
jgi:cell division transport system permease protein